MVFTSNFRRNLAWNLILVNLLILLNISSILIRKLTLGLSLMLQHVLLLLDSVSSHKLLLVMRLLNRNSITWSTWLDRRHRNSLSAIRIHVHHLRMTLGRITSSLVMLMRTSASSISSSTASVVSPSTRGVSRIVRIERRPSASLLTSSVSIIPAS
jgi:hypothetical protein